MRRVALACLLLTIPALASSQSGEVPRTPWGDPDLRGYWDYRTITRLERPSDLADTAVLTPEEAERYEAVFNAQRAEVGDYDEDLGSRLAEGRTSLIVDPPDGQIPMSPGNIRAPGSRHLANRRPRGTDGYEQRGPTGRCISRSTFPRVPTLYNNFYQIFQTPAYVVIYSEMIHDARIISLNGSPHIDPRIRQAYGDARGHWEGDALVINTTNFSDALSWFWGWSESLNLTERFTPHGDGTIRYEFTIDDPTAFESSWTVQIPLRPFEGPLYEYACHEGNSGLRDILTISRKLEKMELEAKTAR